jgi:hypothetical protein
VAKYKTFDEFVKGEKIVRYTEWFKKCWDFATEAAVENGSTNNKPMPKCLCLSCSRLQSNGGSCQPNANSFVTACGGYSGTSA